MKEKVKEMKEMKEKVKEMKEIIYFC